MLEFGEEHTI